MHQREENHVVPCGRPISVLKMELTAGIVGDIR
jgi:hypothetical protein